MKAKKGKGRSRAKKRESKSGKMKPKTKISAETKTGKDGKVIVRILGAGQFATNKNTLDELNEMDNGIVELLKKGGNDAEARFRETVVKMVKLVKKAGKPVPHKHIMPSDVIIPHEDITLHEARKIFSGEGVIPERLVF